MNLRSYEIENISSKKRLVYVRKPGWMHVSLLSVDLKVLRPEGFLRQLT